MCIRDRQMTESSSTGSVNDPKAQIEQLLNYAHLAYAGAVFILSMIIYYNASPIPSFSASEANGVLSYINRNLNTSAISAIAKAPCPGGFDPVQMGQFAGLNEGCNCQNIGLKKGPCEETADRICTSSPSVNGKDIYFIAGNAQLCVKRTKSLFANTKGECPIGSKRCSQDFCVLAGEDCPLTHIIIKKGQLDRQEMVNHSIIALNSDTNMLYSSLVNEDPIIGINYTIGDLPCYVEDQRPQISRGINYILNVVPEKGCGRYGGNNVYFEQIFNKTAQEFFQDNQVIEGLKDAPGYLDLYGKEPTFFWAEKKIVIQNEACTVFLDEKARDQAHNEYVNLMGRYKSYANTLRFFGLLALGLSAYLFYMIRICIKQMNFTKKIAQINIMYWPFIGAISLAFIVMYLFFANRSQRRDYSGKVSAFSLALSKTCFKATTLNQAIKDLSIDDEIKDAGDFMLYPAMVFGISVLTCTGIFGLLIVRRQRLHESKLLQGGEEE
eukprot:TRINITY_DN31193_c0_g1_i1.p1 TRINITY_DN31193_c0_g1~~TRINITY_DN31193_c0_g1_i1.p1  ORF type:complete len:496 (+),score=36.61 TRINITY_DN31193_c0_g1_i1:62-1549(+)